MRPQLKIVSQEREEYVVVQLPNPDKLPLAGRLIVKIVVLPLLRFVVRAWGYSTTGQIQTICTDVEGAESVLSTIEKGIAYPVPVDSPLPLEAIRHGQPIYSNSLKARYEQKRLRCLHVSVKRCDLEKLADANLSMTRSLAKIGVKGT